ncbi:MAG: TetR/AcrR family transcriptional regulator [Phycisphaerae bacterium]|jgi:AcrR family transcriptional regulator
MIQTTRERLIQKAHELFYREGFHAVGLDRVLSEVGVTKTTFYNHFESKDELIVEVVSEHDRWWRETFRTMLRERGGDDPRAQLRVVFDVLDDVMTGDEYRGCIFINVAVEFPLPHDPAHKAAAENKRAIQGIIHDLAQRAGAVDPDAFAEKFSILMEGTYVTQQVTQNPRATRIAGQLADGLLRQYFPDGGTG